jgi:hypothetical protein
MTPSPECCGRGAQRVQWSAHDLLPGRGRDPRAGVARHRAILRIRGARRHSHQTMTPDARPLQRFAFVANSRSFMRAAFIAQLLLLAGAMWALHSGRIGELDSAYIGVIATCVLVLPPLLAGAMLLSARRDAAILGGIELDGDGIRWRKPDASFVFNVAWSDVECATADGRRFTLVLSRRAGEPVVIAALAPNGLASDLVVLERFQDLLKLVEDRVPVSGHSGRGDPSAARRTVFLGLHGGLTSAALYAVNTAIGSRFKWTEALLTIPSIVGVFALIILVAGIQLFLRRAPLVSPLYNPAYQAQVRRVLVLAAVLNFVLLVFSNAR